MLENDDKREILMLKVIIRDAGLGDLEVINEIRKSAICNGAIRFYSPMQIKAWSDKKILSLDTLNTPKFFLAMVNSNPIGFGSIDLIKASVSAIYVCPEHMGQGIGSRILSVLESTAKLKDLNKLTLDASLNARLFYRNRGYIELSKTSGFFYGVESEYIFMEKLL